MIPFTHDDDSIADQRFARQAANIFSLPMDINETGTVLTMDPSLAF